jgi:2-haloacid dehalogenase
MALEDVKALTFDVFGTVVDWRGSIAREAAELLGADKGLERDWNAFALSWRNRYQPAMERVRSGNRGFVKLDVLHRENLLEVLEEFEIAGLSEAEIDHLNFAWHRLDPWPDTVPGMSRLRTRYPLATLSNGNVALIVNMARRAGLPWDAVLGAEVARAYKPMPEAYLSAADMLGVAPAECMLVAAHNDDLMAAKAAGLGAAFVCRPTEVADQDQTKDREPWDGVDVAATSFEDLADKLGC